MLNWKSLKKRINNRIQITRKIFYEVLYIEDFRGGETLGEMRPDTKQIVIKSGQSPKNTVVTYIHELLHAISEEYEVQLTETQILKLERAIYYILKENNVFKDKE